MARKSPPSFVLELPLQTATAVELVLAIRLDAVRNIYSRGRLHVWRRNSPYGRMWRGFVGCGLAYVMALQLILSGLVVVSSITLLSAAHGAEHCVISSGDDDSALPGDHPAACRCGPACAMSACAAIVGGHQAKATIAWPPTSASLRAPRLDSRATLPRAMAEGPHSPRAPPAA